MYFTFLFSGRVIAEIKKTPETFNIKNIKKACFIFLRRESKGSFTDETDETVINEKNKFRE